MTTPCPLALCHPLPTSLETLLLRMWEALRKSAVVAHSGSDAPRPDRKVRWGIMGTGAIAADFTRVLSQQPDAEVAALGSRSAERAAEFARELGIDAGVTTLHSSYDDLVADDSLDIIYVATPSLRHVCPSEHTCAMQCSACAPNFPPPAR